MRISQILTHDQLAKDKMNHELEAPFVENVGKLIFGFCMGAKQSKKYFALMDLHNLRLSTMMY